MAVVVARNDDRLVGVLFVKCACDCGQIAGIECRNSGVTQCLRDLGRRGITLADNESRRLSERIQSTGEEGQVSQTYISSLSAVPVILFATEPMYVCET